MDEIIENDFEKENERLSRLIHIFGSRHGEFGGVTFDLRHESIASEQWSCPVPHSPSMTIAAPDLPWIWYPWYGLGDEEADYAGTKGRRVKSHSRFFGIRSAECIVEIGDKITIDRVEHKQLIDTLEHDHDSDIRLVF